MIESIKIHDETDDHVLKNPIEHLCAAHAARLLEMLYIINIPDCDRARLRVTMHGRVKEAKAIDGFDCRRFLRADCG